MTKLKMQNRQTFEDYLWKTLTEMKVNTLPKKN